MRWGDRRTAVWLAASVLAIAITAGCADGGIPDEDASGSTSSTTIRDTSTTSSGTETTMAGDAEETVAARYRAYWEARLAANQPPPSPESPLLRDVATGDQLEQLVRETQANLDRGHAIRAGSDPPRQRIHVLSISTDNAEVRECVVDDAVIYKYETGEVVNDAVATHSVRGRLVLEGGQWKVAAVELIQRWDGVAGCAIAEGL